MQKTTDVLEMLQKAWVQMSTNMDPFQDEAGFVVKPNDLCELGLAIESILGHHIEVKQSQEQLGVIESC